MSRCGDITRPINLSLFTKREKQRKKRETARTFTVIAGNQCRLLCPPVRVFREVKPVLELVLLLRLERTRIRQVVATPRHGDLYSRKAMQVRWKTLC